MNDPLKDAITLAATLVERVGSVLEGKREVVELAVVGLLAEGHVLVEDVPGVGKTTLARALAASLGLTFRRVQFTSDLLPVDVVGGNVFDRDRNDFVFRPGPVFTQLLLADEINRTTPKTQSALLEAMGERQVSIDGKTYALEAPFFVIATQNPLDFHGTYPLPESQLDRFLLRLRIGHPPVEVERRLLAERQGADPVQRMESFVSAEALRAAQAATRAVHVDASVHDYLHAIVLATRRSGELAVGASTRAALAVEGAVRARALVKGRDYALPDDVKALAVPALAHRVHLAGAHEAQSAREDAEGVLQALVDGVPVPT
ncbi:MAG: AAA family ATPase [Myxococcota bacterium]